MTDTIQSLWRSRLVHLAGFLVAAALGVLVDIKLPGTSHVAIFLPLAIGALTELGGLTGKFDAAVLNPRTRNLLMLAAGAAASYLTSTPAASGWRFAPTAIALLFSMQRVLSGGGAGGAKIGALLLAFVLPSASCKTGSSPDGGGPPVITEVIHCAEQATHVAALNILDDVASALVTNNWRGALADLVGRWGEAAVACAVQEIAGESAHAFQASGDALENLKAERGRSYLSAHPAVP